MRLICYRRLLICLGWLLSLQAMAEPARKPGGEIKTGKWVGYLKPDDSKDAIALTMDSYLVKPSSDKEFPRLTLLFKLSLGGYLSSEYESEVFEDLQYDFDQGLLTLDESRNEMVIDAVVYSSPRTQMEGKVLLRSTATTATLFLEYQTDEPEEEGDSPKEKVKFAPLLAGQYEGTCGKEKAVLQLETAKGMTLETPVPTTGLHHYHITGVLGVENGLCPEVNPAGRPQWCVDHAFSSGSYDFFQGKLLLSGMLETEECTRKEDELTCRMRLLAKNVESEGLIEETCRFRKVHYKITAFKISPRRFHVVPSTVQRKPLPLPDPPVSRELVSAVDGTFYGYLHHETLDQYQPIRLISNGTTSTDNSHNNNNVFVSVSAVLHFGRELSRDLWVQTFDRRSMYLISGYALDSAETDTFLQVKEWTVGFISGEWYSKAFGKVGSFEVLKGVGLPPLNSQAKMVENIAGQFRGPEEKDPKGKEFWDLRLHVPNQPRFVEKSYLVFQGNYQLYAGGVTWPIRKILSGAYDIYSGAIGFMTDDQGAMETKLVGGMIEGPEKLRLFWPNERTWAVGVFDHEFGTHRRVNE